MSIAECDGRKRVLLQSLPDQLDESRVRQRQRCERSVSVPIVSRLKH